MLRTHARQAGWYVFLLISAAGCNPSGLASVQGVVKLDGRPLAGASVLFIAQDAGGRDARGSTDAEGKFRLSTFAANDGALPGNYKVVVQPAAASNPGPAAATPEEAQRPADPAVPRDAGITVPPRYSQPDQTILTQIVPVERDVVLELQSK